MEERESKIESATLRREFPSFRQNTDKGIILRGGDHDQEINLRGDILLEEMELYSPTQEFYRFIRSGEGMEHILDCSQTGPTFQYSPQRIDNCNAVDIPFFCFSFEPILFEFPSTTFTPFITPIPLTTPFGHGTIYDETIIIFGRSRDYCSCPACGGRRLPFSTGERFPQDGFRRRTVGGTSHESFGFDEKEFLISLNQGG